MGHVVCVTGNMGFRPRAAMGFGFFFFSVLVIRLSRYVVLIRARKSCLYHT